MNSRSLSMLGVCCTLCGGLMGAELFSVLRFPMPWLLGSIAGSAAVSILGLPTGIPYGLRSAVMAVIGLMIGSTVDHGVLSSISRWPISMAAVAIYVVVVTAVAYIFLRRFAGFDPITAYFASAPGGYLAMIMMGTSYGGRERNIAMTQVVRMTLVVFTLVIAYSLLFGVGASHPFMSQAGGHLGFFQIVELMILGTGGWYLGTRMHIPAGEMLVPLILIAAVQLLGMPAVQVPELPLLFAQYVVGSSIGADFSGITPRELKQGLFVSAGLAGFMLVLSLIFSIILGLFTKFPVKTLFLALSPGGLSGISLIALALGHNPAFVTAHNVLRMMLIIFGAPLFFRMIKGRTGSAIEGSDLKGLLLEDFRKMAEVFRKILVEKDRQALRKLLRDWFSRSG
jgi:membrane AbrB-like protein